MKTLAATVREAHEGEQRWFCGGGLITFKATEQETGGALLLFEDQLTAGKLTPLHVHPDADETFCMLEGDIELFLDGERRALGPGGIAFIPRGVPHAFMVTSQQARMWCVQTPGSGEAFYRMASEPVVEGEPATPVDLARVQEAALATNAIQVLGPPPFEVPGP